MDSSLCKERRRAKEKKIKPFRIHYQLRTLLISSPVLCCNSEISFSFYESLHTDCKKRVLCSRNWGFCREKEKEREKAFLELGFEKQEAAVVEIMPGRGACSGAGVGRLPGYWVCVLVLCALVTGYVSACPALCTCSGTTVDCHGLGIKTMPRNIPRNTERL